MDLFGKRLSLTDITEKSIVQNSDQRRSGTRAVRKSVWRAKVSWVINIPFLRFTVMNASVIKKESIFRQKTTERVERNFFVIPLHHRSTFWWTCNFFNYFHTLCPSISDQTAVKTRRSRTNIHVLLIIHPSKNLYVFYICRLTESLNRYASGSTGTPTKSSPWSRIPVKSSSGSVS